MGIAKHVRLVRTLAVWACTVSLASMGLMVASAALTPQLNAGEYSIEETTSSVVDEVHSWTHTEGGYTISVTNSNRSQLSVPLDVDGAQSCGLAAFTLTDGNTLTIGSLDQACTIPLFPFLDRLINQQVQALVLSVDGQRLEIPTTDADRLALARVGDRSRDVYLLFQEEVAKAVAFYTNQPGTDAEASDSEAPNAAASAPPSAPIPEPSLAPAPEPNPEATPVAEASASSSSGQETPPVPEPAPDPQAAVDSPAALEIVGNIGEQVVPAGGSRITVNAVNNGGQTAIAAQARFEFLSNNQVIDTRTVAFEPNDVPAGESARAQVLKTETNWDTVRVSFVWERPLRR
ncbi:MAG: hypothetical protein AAF974_12320 [Cyanobacteria bacterium P01_E01_bin.34]